MKFDNFRWSQKNAKRLRNWGRSKRKEEEEEEEEEEEIKEQEVYIKDDQSPRRGSITSSKARAKPFAQRKRPWRSGLNALGRDFAERKIALKEEEE